MKRSGYRKITDPQVRVRLCDECHAVIAGIYNMGWYVWIDVTPCTPEVEIILRRMGRAMYLVQPGPARTATIDSRLWSEPGSIPHRGLVFAEHPHQSPGPKVVDDPPWVMGKHTKAAPAKDDEEVLF